MYFLLEELFVVGAMLFFMGAIIPVLRNPGHVTTEIQASDFLTVLLQLVVYGGVKIFMVPNRGRLRRVLAQNPLLCSLLLLILISTIWSPVPSFTLRRAIWFMLTTGFGLYLGTRFEIKEQIRLVVYALAICVFLSVVFIVALPRYGMDIAMYHGAWRGVFYHKNSLGCYMVVAAITFFCFRPGTAVELLVKYLGLALSLCLLIGSVAKGAYVTMLVSIFLIFLYRLLRIYWKRLIPVATVALTVLGIAVAYVASNPDVFLRALGKDSSLTGRIPMWTTVLAISSGKRWLGYGFAGFWAANSHAVWSILGWKPAKAHNGYIDLLVDLGWFGLGIFVLNTLLAFWRSVKLVARERTTESQWPLLMLSVILVYNIFETDLMQVHSFFWVAYVTITVSMQQAWSLSRTAAPAMALKMPQLSGAGYEPCPQ
jgi:exopolysaccharide production protein ExoQ